jgi:hypothetical protein
VRTFRTVVKVHLRKSKLSAGHERLDCGNPVLRVGLYQINHNAIFNHSNQENKPWKDEGLSTYLFDPNDLRFDAPELPEIDFEDRG